MYKSKYSNLMQHLMNEHDLILLDSEQQEIEKWVEKDLTAISVTRCCATLKGKEAMTFEDWLISKGYEPYNVNVFVKGDSLMHKVQLKKMYEAEQSL